MSNLCTMTQPKIHSLQHSHSSKILLLESMSKLLSSAGDLLMVLCVTMAAAVLAASFAVFLVREAECRSKHVQARAHRCVI